LKEALASGLYKGWLAQISDGTVLAGGGVLLSPWPSHPRDPQPRRAHILNLYTYPNHRRKGLARMLMQTMIEWCRQQGFATVSLHASDDGKPLCQVLGFRPTNEMRLSLREESGGQQ
jgi:GNAT superfamily N-acetyltransferase